MYLVMTGPHLQHFHLMMQCSYSMHATVLPREQSTDYMPRKEVVSPTVYIL